MRFREGARLFSIVLIIGKGMRYTNIEQGMMMFEVAEN